ncbi:ferritin family protein [Chloroflexota bacterium]
MSQAYCVKCRKTVEIRNPKTILLKNKSLAITGTCPICDTKVFRFVKRHIDPIAALKIAIEREKEAQRFYRDSARDTSDNNGKKLLEFLANEEVWHQKGLEKQLSSMMASNSWQAWKEESAPISINDLVETAETAHTRQATSYKHVTTSERSAVRTALRAELKAIQFYQDFAEATTDPDGKKIFVSLVKQEKGHATVLLSVMDMIKKHKRFPLLPRFLT